VRDTSPQDDAAFTALFAARSGAERLRMTCQMFDDAKALAAAGILAEDPGIAPDELRRRIFDRLYAGDFDPETRMKFRSAL
jgi:hypothetical protein